MINTPAKRTIRRDRGMGMSSQLSTIVKAQPDLLAREGEKAPLRETLIDYDAGFIAALNVKGKSFFNRNPFGVDDNGKPNQPYHEFHTGTMGYLIRVREVPAPFKVPDGGALICNFKLVRVTKFNADGSVKQVTIAVTGKPIEAKPNCRVKTTGNAEGVTLDENTQLFAIDNNSAVVVTKITEPVIAA
jgi:hypothetical protein